MQLKVGVYIILSKKKEKGKKIQEKIRTRLC